MLWYAEHLLGVATSLSRRFHLTSGYRSFRQQSQLYARWLRGGQRGLPVAPPGRSMHELGRAVDLSGGRNPYEDEELLALGRWWASNGLGWSPSDPVHFQLDPIGGPAAGVASGEHLARPLPGLALTQHPIYARSAGAIETVPISNLNEQLFDVAYRAVLGSISSFIPGAGELVGALLGPLDGRGSGGGLTVAEQLATGRAEGSKQILLHGEYVTVGGTGGLAQARRADILADPVGVDEYGAAL